ncbi:hypothetical protein K2Z83_06970 [Oscillochloris sp. ZM17-4]|uniref:hypothetical protein n=1 Tax=Oscillochloris sp. ZM17-4 TaxID=2866714 RepID=UPI001C7302D4|nr:hypothetical protein [Oscillochloris sp. ZM17-4]MBX0327417.1 hypothetical protein [Oscillochloris sp. ZM17-4]
MRPFTVTRAHLRAACESQSWDLLDKLLEIDPSRIDDNALFTDTWGTWWGMLIAAIVDNSPAGVRVLLKHGACRDQATWGDCVPETALELARDKPAILALLQSDQTPTYVRETDPPLPEGESPQDQATNRQGEIRDATGLVFQVPPEPPA